MAQINDIASILPNSVLDLDTSSKNLRKVSELSKRELADEKKFNDAVNGFESMLLNEMLKSLWQTVEVKGWFGEEESNESKIYRDMLNQALADSIAQGKGIGVKDVIRRELTKQTDVTKNSEG